ncbi:GNAT family N-acetyltransferase [Stackebrandtia nassauensis]|uniref:GCN5-related N-acetyltransferase n=1 Tax=Stackebrandtia nassauensis (strain DSM 44728 / CIP 108903 / NRRL B-16338 / NBRC 102104 / LLR-40K-21) TaxID=446470 RepID=D3PYQ2_STANL|nr:GNAT family N-acetyltransferase [Stackebrandtia nassauensis]ADD43485.1 GCN5-related N-acetyltransferase [Stackebrandtia nassauensis DSM 44728]
MSSFPVLKGREAILAAYRAEPFVSCFLADNAEGVVRDDAVAWFREFNGRSVLMGDGPVRATARLVAELAPHWRPDRLTVPQEVFEQLPGELRSAKPGRWHWFFTRSAPPTHPAESRVRWCTESDFDAITALLDVAFPDASSRPDPAVPHRRWFGATDANGSIVACGIAQVGDGIGPMLGSIAVHPDARRQGLGSAITSWVTRRLLDEGNAMVALGSYAGEEATHRIYRRLGYRDTRVLASGRLEPSPAH